MAQKKERKAPHRADIWSISREERGEALENMTLEDREYYYKEIRESEGEKGE
ncbi:MAG: hypothetical protein GX349_08200 [Firmicutes bacterium]|nr:hypothetical protein [Bacillota bacterium]